MLGSGFLFGSSTSTGAATASPLPFLAPFFASGGAAAAGVPRLLSFDLETSALSIDYVGSSGVASPASACSASAASSGFGSSSSSSL